MIRIDLEPVPGTKKKSTRTKERSLVYRASAVVDGHTYYSQSRLNAVSGLARQLVAASIPEGSVLVFSGGKLALRYRSLYKLADRMLVETPTVRLRSKKFREFPNL